MHSSPFSKKHQARLLGKNQREKYPFTFKLISALDSNSREKKSDSTRRYYRRRVVRESSPRVRGFETNAFAFKALFAKSRGSIYSLFLSEDPPATKALKVKSQRHGKEDTKQIFHRAQGSCGCGVSNISSRKTTFFSLVFTVFSFLRIINFFVCITCEQREY